MTGTKAPAGGRKKRKKSGVGVLFLILGLLLAGLFYLVSSRPDISELFTAHKVWIKLGKPVIRTVVFISIGLLIGQLIESLGLTARLGRLAWPLINWARLPGAAGTAFTAAFISGVLANTFLLTAYQEERLTKKGLFLANLLNASIPAYVLHMPTTMFVIISLTGRAGLIYTLLTLAAAIIRLLGVALVSRIIMPVCAACEFEKQDKKQSLAQIWADTWPKFKTRLVRIIVVVVPVYGVVVLVAELGFFNWLKNALTGWVVGSLVPIEAMSVVIFSVVAEFASGMAAAGALLQSGALTVKEVVLALLIGNILATPVRTLRHQLPHYMGIYSPDLGAKLLVTGQTVRIISVILVGLVFIAVY